MKKIFLVIATLLCFPACTPPETETEQAMDYSKAIVGKWLQTETTGGYESIDSSIYDFHADNSLTLSYTLDSEDVTESNYQWYTTHDTLTIARRRSANGEPGMPAWYRIERLTDTDMVWYNMMWHSESHTYLTRITD